MQVHFKQIIWGSIDIPKGKEKEVLKLLKKGEIQDSNDLCNMLGISIDYMYDTVEDMQPCENDNQPTIEVFTNDSTENAIWVNV